MDWAMTLLRELRELGNDMAYLTGTMRGRLSKEQYDKLYRELNRRIESAKKELADHLDSK